MARVLFLAFAALACAQEPIQITTRLVEIPVIVRDSHGPVVDLTEDSFKLLEDGKPRRIAVFRGSFNQKVKSDQQPRNKVLFIDALNTVFSDQVLVRTQILKMLDQTEIRNPVSIYVAGETVRMIQDFTTDVTKLKSAMEAFRPAQSRLLTAPMRGVTPIPCATRICSQGPDGVAALVYRQRVAMTLSAFEALEEHLMQRPGPSTVVWISDEFPVNFLFDEDSRRWRRLSLAIYPVHARGLATAVQRLDSALWIADQTGGRAFYNRNDIGEAINEAMEEDSVNYTLGFYAQREKPDGNFHRLQVRVDRPNVEVRSRTGYVDREPKGK